MTVYLHNAAGAAALVTLLDSGAQPTLSWSLPVGASVPASYPSNNWALSAVVGSSSNVFQLASVSDHSDLVLVQLDSGLGVQSVARTRETVSASEASRAAGLVGVCYFGLFLLVGLTLARNYQSRGKS